MEQHLSRPSLAGLEFARNPQRRCPTLLLLDTSDSMDGGPISELNTGLHAYKESVESNALAASRIEIAIVCFGDQPQVYQHQIRIGGQVESRSFTTVNQFNPPVFSTSGRTAMGGGIHAGLNLLQARKQEYRMSGISYYRQWVFILTDGIPTDEWESARKRLEEELARKGILLFVVAVGDGCNMAILRQLSPERKVLRLKDLNFVEFFYWLSESQQAVSTSQSGVHLPLPPRDWEKKEENWDGVNAEFGSSS